MTIYPRECLNLIGRSPTTYWLKMSSIFLICAGLNSENSKYTCRLVMLGAYSLAVSSPFESDESSCMVGTYNRWRNGMKCCEPKRVNITESGIRVDDEKQKPTKENVYWTCCHLWSTLRVFTSYPPSCNTYGIILKYFFKYL